MALKLAFTLPTPALLGAATAIPTLLAAIPGAIDYWDVAHAAPVVSAGTVTQIPTVFGPDPLDTQITGAGGTRTLVSQEGRAGVQFAGYSGLSTTGFSDGELTGGFSIVRPVRFSAAKKSPVTQFAAAFASGVPLPIATLVPACPTPPSATLLPSMPG